jgi:hypothetical protein
MTEVTSIGTGLRELIIAFLIFICQKRQRYFPVNWSIKVIIFQLVADKSAL